MKEEKGWGVIAHMGLENLLEQQKTAISKQWFKLIADTYKRDVAQFIGSQKDRFANPVGSMLNQNLQPILDELTGDMNPTALSSLLDPILRIRAVQGFSPSKAIGFVFGLKKLIRDVLKADQPAEDGALQLQQLEARIDQLALIGFDKYMECREKIYQLQANEMRNRTFSAFNRAGLVKDPPDKPEFIFNE
jgi:hypothetical protein